MSAGTEAFVEATPPALYEVPLPPEPPAEAAWPEDPAEAPHEPTVARVLPSAPESERMVLGGLMVAGRGVRNLRLQPKDFYVPKHGLVFAAMMRLADRGNPVDPAAVVGVLVDTGEIRRAGGSEYVHSLLEYAVAGTVGYHAEQVREKAAARDQIATGVRIQQIGYQPDLTAAERAELTQKLAAELDPQLTAPPAAWLDVLENTLSAVENAAANPTGLLGVSTGLVDLDKALRGYQRGQLYVIAARPGIGKSVMLQGAARASALKRGLPVGFFSLEMNQVELAMRIVAAELRIPLDKLKTGSLGEKDWQRVAELMGSEGAPLFIEDRPGQSLAEIRTAAMGLQRQGGLDLLLIDYLQLITVPANRDGNRQQQVAELSRGLKLLAKELDVPVVVACQTNRQSEARSNKRPQLSDLRESGAIEADADVVILLHRDDYYDQMERPGEADLIIAKNRHGETRTVTVVSQLHYSRFCSAEMHL